MRFLWSEVKLVRVDQSSYKTVLESLIVKSSLKGTRIPKNYSIYIQNIFVIKNQNNIFYILRYLPLLKTTKLKRMPMFEAVFASGVAFKEDLENQAMKLVSEIGPHVQDQESLKLICLLQLMTPPKTWMEQVVIIPIRIISQCQK